MFSSRVFLLAIIRMKLCRVWFIESARQEGGTSAPPDAVKIARMSRSRWVLISRGDARRNSTFQPASPDHKALFFPTSYNAQSRPSASALGENSTVRSVFLFHWSTSIRELDGLLPGGWSRRRESNPHEAKLRQILSLLRLPVPPLRASLKVARQPGGPQPFPAFRNSSKIHPQFSTAPQGSPHDPAGRTGSLGLP